MKSIKKIIGIAGDFGFFEKNKEVFKNLDILVLQIKDEDDLEKCDGVFFGTSSFFQLQNYYGDDFFDKIVLKIESGFPVLCFGQSINFFLEKIGNNGDGGIVEKDLKHNEISFDDEISLNFLDSKKIKTRFFKISNFYNFTVEPKIKKIIFFILKNFFIGLDFDNIENFGKTSFGKNSVYTYKKTLFIFFSPEFYGDNRIYEYFINKFF